MHNGIVPPNGLHPEMYLSRRSMGPVRGVHHSDHYSYPPITPANWQTVTLRAAGGIPPQQTFQESAVFGATSNTYTPHPQVSFDFANGPGGIPHDHGMGTPIPYSLSHETNAEADNTFDIREEMERQSLPEMMHLSRSSGSLMPSSVSSDIPTRRSGPDFTPSISDHNHGAMDPQPNPVERVSSRELIEDTFVEGQTLPEVWTPNVAPVYETNPATITSSPLSVPISWCMIPQPQYTSRTRDMSFLQLRRITFSVNGTPGFNLRSALEREFVGLDGRDDPVLENANGPVSCRLLFPGYPTNTRCSQIAVRNWKKEVSPIMRSKLAYEVAKRVDQYLGALAETQINPSVHPQWTAGQGYMKLEKMYLLNVSWVSKGSLQPEIWVDTAES